MNILSSLIKIDPRIFKVIETYLEYYIPCHNIGKSEVALLRESVKINIAYIIGRQIMKNYAIPVLNKQDRKYIEAYALTHILQKAIGSSWRDVKIMEVEKLKPYPYPLEVKFLGKEYFYVEEVQCVKKYEYL